MPFVWKIWSLTNHVNFCKGGKHSAKLCVVLLFMQSDIFRICSLNDCWLHTVKDVVFTTGCPRSNLAERNCYISENIHQHFVGLKTKMKHLSIYLWEPQFPQIIGVQTWWQQIACNSIPRIQFSVKATQKKSFMIQFHEFFRESKFMESC